MADPSPLVDTDPSPSLEDLRAQLEHLQHENRRLRSQLEQASTRQGSLADRPWALVEHAPDVIARFGPDLRHLYVNPAIEVATGIPQDVWMGRSHRELGLPAGYVTLWEHHLLEVFVTGQPREFDFSFPSSGGSRHFNAQLVPEFEPDGACPFVLAIARDITARIQVETELAAANQRLQELDRLKGDFINAASHELRTPLTSIMGYAEFLEDEIAGPLNPAQHDFTHQIQESCRRLQRIVDDMLDFARMEAGTFHLLFQDTSLGGLVHAELASLRPQAQEAQLELAIDLPDEPLAVRADPKRLGQVLLNLVSNAIKFSPPGGRVRVSALREEDMARISVSDTGIGIAPEHLPRLFDKFFQVDPSLTRERGGAGLGLSISKVLVEAHGGRIGVTSEPAKGSTFWFSLPLAPEASRLLELGAAAVRDEG